jgi:nitric oxide reductase NorD protein
VSGYAPTDLAARLDALLNPVLSSRRTARPLAQALAVLTRDQQEYALRWVEVIGRTNYELAYQFAAHAVAALPALDAGSAEAWIVAAMDAFDREGLYAGTRVLQEHARFASRAHDTAAVTFEEVAPVLKHFVHGLSGRALALASAPRAWTDTDTLYLPPRIAITPDKRGNFLIYKLIATLLWAQTRYGTYNVDLAAATQSFIDPERALSWLAFLESVRLQARVDHALPGLAREVHVLKAKLNIAEHGDSFPKLRAPQATLADSLAMLDTLDLSEDAPEAPWLGELRPAEANTVRAERIHREKSELQAALAQVLKEQNASKEDAEFSIEVDADTPDEAAQFTLKLGNETIPPPERLRKLVNAIVQDLGEVPPDWLRPDDRATDGSDDDIETPDEPALFYDEWDHQRGHYRKAWCSLREVALTPGDEAFVSNTLEKYAPQVRQLKRTFEMLRGEDKLVKRMPHGDDIDLDAVIAARADLHAGMELGERLHVKRHKTERSLAVLFMVDMSGSTKGWVNEAERESLVLLAEALEILGDRYAIHGFSGMTRKRCEIFPVKDFDEPYSRDVRARIAGMTPQDYTRMGAAIRHLTARLLRAEARTRLLITLSDGKPDDYSDHYRGDYGIEDTRKALIEARHAGVKPFCITIDHEARAYLPHMYGAANWTMVDDVLRLPLKVAEIYRRITT